MYQTYIGHSDMDGNGEAYEIVYPFHCELFMKINTIYIEIANIVWAETMRYRVTSALWLTISKNRPTHC